jgi:diketogulonate reductase-like aldo/keto reductase
VRNQKPWNISSMQVQITQPIYGHKLFGPLLEPSLVTRETTFYPELLLHWKFCTTNPTPPILLHLRRTKYVKSANPILLINEAWHDLQACLTQGPKRQKELQLSIQAHLLSVVKKFHMRIRAFSPLSKHSPSFGK